MEHPDADDLAAFAEGELDASRRGEVEAHIDACGACAELVAALVRAYGSADGIVSTADGAIARPPRAELGGKLGRFHLLDEVGSGAMGVVFAAYDPDLDRRVALKVLRRRGDDAPDVRFLREAQAMARLSHPNVITVHEAGVVDGQLYISMEFVDGSTLGRWLAEGTRAWTDVFDVFVQIARGLAAAHAAGLVHRDIKPDNILIEAAAPGVGRVRVTDFGLARPARLALPDGDTPAPTVDALATDLTQAGSLVGTPAYMSPEQLRGETADAASDQFGYCVAFHEALAGVRPFAGERLPELVDNVTEGRRREMPADRNVPRWLRHLVSRGLSIDPRERFPSMDALLEDLERGRRAPRRRRQIAVVVGALAIGGASTMIFGALSDPACSGADERFAGIWDPARKVEVQAALLAVDRPYAESTWRRVQVVLDDYRQAWIDGYVDACEATAVRRTQSEAMLDARMRCLERHRSRLAALVDVFAAADDNVLQNAAAAVDELPSAIACADPELLTRQVALPEDPQTRERATELRDELARAASLEAAGQYGDGLELARRLEQEARELGDEPLHAEALLRLGVVLDQAGEYVDAEATLEQAVWLGRANGHSEVVRDATIALVTASQGRHGTSEVALKWAHDAWAELRRTPDPAAHAELLLLEANAMRETNRYDEALPKLKEAVEIRIAWLGESHPQTALALSDLAKVEEAKGEYDASLASNERAVEILEAALGPDHPQFGYALMSLAYTHAELFHHDQAIALEKRALAIFESSLEPDHPRIAKTLSNLGNSLAHSGKLEEAEAMLERSAQLHEARMGPDHHELANPLLLRAQILVQAARPRDALALALRGLKILETAEADETRATDKQILSSAYSVVSNIYVELGQKDEAIATAKRMLDTDLAVYGAQHEEVAMARLNLGTIYGMLQQFEDSREQLEAALPVLKAKLGEDHPYVAMTLNNLSSVYRETNQPERAIEVAQASLAIKRSRGDAVPQEVGLTEYNIGTAYASMGRHDEAIEWLDRALGTFGEVEEVDPAHLGDLRFDLAKALIAAGRDKVRARDLAILAKEAYEQTDRPEGKERIVEIDKWLRRL